MASILLLGESCPYRNALFLGTNSQGKMIAQACELTLEELNQMLNCEYLIKAFIPSWKRKHRRYVEDLIKQWKAKEQLFEEHYEVLLVLGKRLASIVLGHDVEFFQVFPHHGLKIASVPNPLAEYWWKDDEHIRAMHDFMRQILKKYA